MSRKLSKELTQHVRTYFQYMDRTRTGVEEDLILSNLPTHYRTQCSHYIKYKCFRRVRPSYHHAPLSPLQCCRRTHTWQRTLYSLS